MRILITAPSLDETLNVSGISTIVRQIIEHGADEFRHFTAGSTDAANSGVGWALKQVLLPFAFAKDILSFQPDVVHINTALTERSIVRDAVLAKIAKLMGKRVVLAVHGGKYLIENTPNSTIEATVRRLLTAVDVVVVYSEFERQHLGRRWPDIDCRMLPNAIPGERIGSSGRANTVPALVYFGRMHESKGLHELVEACGTLARSGFEFSLDAYGEGPMRGQFVQEMSAALGERFTYGGVVSGDDKWDILSGADVFVLPSRYGEGLPMAMLEAMARGCIVIAGDVASVSSVVDDGTNGFLVKPYDPAGLASKIKLVLSDKPSWPRIREAAMETVRENFEIKGYIEELSAIYRAAAAGKR
jgi:glycosyltransferase involved in cell wall biosynthesis